MTRQMIIGLHPGNGDGALPGAWRMPGVDPRGPQMMAVSTSRSWETEVCNP